jgi:hypothetical protein
MSIPRTWQSLHGPTSVYYVDMYFIRKALPRIPNTSIVLAYCDRDPWSTTRADRCHTNMVLNRLVQ